MRSAFRQCLLQQDRRPVGGINVPGRLWVLALCLLVSSTLSADDPDPRAEQLAEAFQDLTQYRFNRAAETFALLAADAAWEGRRDAWFGQAAALFNVQPQSPARIEEARQLLEQVRAVNPRDDLGIGARYFLARVQQVHQVPADRPGALVAWQELFHDHPGHYLGQLALVRWVLLEAYLPEAKAQKEEFFRRLESLQVEWVDEHLESLFHLVTADALMVVLQDAERATGHYRRAVAPPEARRLMLTDALVRAGEAARLAGVADVAIDAYTEFLRLSPRDPRAWLVRQHLEAVAGGPHE